MYQSCNDFYVKQTAKLFSEELVDLITKGKNEEVLQLLIANNTMDYLIDTDKTKIYLLHLAAKYNNIVIIKHLISSGCKLNVEDTYGMTPLTIALTHENFEAVVILYEAQVDYLTEQSIEPTLKDSEKLELRKKIRGDLRDEIISLARKWKFSYEKILQLLARFDISMMKDVKYADAITTEIVTKSSSKDTSNSEKIISRVMSKLKLQPKFTKTKRPKQKANSQEDFAMMDDDEIDEDAVATKAFVESLSTDSSYPEKVISRALSNYDLNDMHKLIKQGRNDLWKGRCFELFRALVNDIEMHLKTKKGTKFLQQVFSWEGFEEKHLEYLEKVLMEAKSKNLRIFLQYDLHVFAKVIYGRDILACLFGNINVQVLSLLGSEIIDVDGRGYKDNTPLHFAVKSELLENVEFLLDRGADPNPSNQKQETPLAIAFFRNRSEKFIKSLLLAGANPLLINDEPFQIHNERNDPLMIYYHRNRPSIAKLIAAHVAIYEISGQSINKPIINYLDITDGKDLTYFYAECTTQLKELKLYEIRDIQINVLMILAENPQEIYRYVSEDDLLEIDTFLEKNRNAMIIYYQEALRKRADDIARIKVCTKKAKRIVCKCIDIQNPYHLVVEKIVGYFSFRDLIKLELYDL